jgi:FKBP-type peptidyl-prolyl cis-trans isomerase FklB
MTPGSLWKIFIPSAQAFGEKGLQGAIPPHSAVIFEVELLEIK